MAVLLTKTILIKIVKLFPGQQEETVIYLAKRKLHLLNNLLVYLINLCFVLI